MPASTPKFQAGTILVREITGFRLLYHYGLWVSENEVIHAQKGRTAISTAFSDFAAGLEVSESIYAVPDPAKAIERARSAVGKWRYHALNKNCESFVLWCATGSEDVGLQSSLIQLGTKLLFPNAAPLLLGETGNRPKEPSPQTRLGDRSALKRLSRDSLAGERLQVRRDSLLSTRDARHQERLRALKQGKKL